MRYALRVSDRTVRRILHKDLKFHSYKLAVVQYLNPRDFVSRKRACELIIENLPSYSSATRHIFMCQDMWIDKTCKIGVTRTSKTLWAAPACRTCDCFVCFIQNWHYWSVFFEENVRVIIVTSVRYANILHVMLEELHLPKLEKTDISDVWFQQDGATAYMTRQWLYCANTSLDVSSLWGAIFSGHHARQI